MGLPIALGSKSVSSRMVEHTPVSIEEFAHDGTILYPRLLQCSHPSAIPSAATQPSQPEIHVPQLPPPPLITWTTSADQLWQAMVSVRYYNMIRKDSQQAEYTVAEVTIQIAPLAESFSMTAYRDSVFPIPLPKNPTDGKAAAASLTQLIGMGGPTKSDDSDLSSDTINATTTPTSRSQLKAIYSSNNRFLTCFIPHPANSDPATEDVARTTALIFQLRKPRAPSTSTTTTNARSWTSSRGSGRRPMAAPPPLPKYIMERSSIDFGIQPLPRSSGTAATTMNATKKANVHRQDSSYSLGGISIAENNTHALRSLLRVATKPQVLSLPNHHVGESVTAACNVTVSAMSAGDYGPCFLLVGCRSGRIVAVSYRPVRVVATVWNPASEPHGLEAVDSTTATDANSIIQEATTADNRINPSIVVSRTPATARNSSSVEGVSSSSSSSSTSSQASTSSSRSTHSLSTQSMATTIDALSHWTIGTNDVNCNDTTNDDGDDPCKTHGRLVVLFGNGHASIFQTLQQRRRIRCLRNSNHLTTNGGGRDGNPRHSPSLTPPPWDVDESERSLTNSWHDYGDSERARSKTATANHEYDWIMTVTETHRLSGPFLPEPCWIATSYVALMRQPPRSASTPYCKVQVYGLYAQGRASVISSFKVTRDQLDEDAHTKSHSHSIPGMIPIAHDDGCAISNGARLEYDTYTDCLAVSGLVGLRSFSCIWQWRSNTQGLTIVQAEERKHHGELSLSFNNGMPTSLHFARNLNNHLRLVHITGFVRHLPIRIRKETYEAGVLSPPRDGIMRSARIGQACPLLLSSRGVAYPSVTRVSCAEDFQIEWKESFLPASYEVSCGGPIMAAACIQSGRHVAVASSRGMCILDCAEASIVTMDSDQQAVKAHVPRARWNLFGNEAEEKSFRVIAMTWWEGQVQRTGAKWNDSLTEDILVAVTEAYIGGELCRYLSCWSPKRLDRRHQLLRSSSQRRRPLQPKWGIRLPADFKPNTIDLLLPPQQYVGCVATEPSVRNGWILLVDSSQSTQYQVFAVQVVERSDNSAEEYLHDNPYEVLARCTSKGSIGSQCELFLAGASHSFDLSCDPDGDRADAVNCLATLGVVRSDGGGVDAVAVVSDSVVAVGRVVEPAHVSLGDAADSEVSRYSLSDIVSGRRLSRLDRPDDFYVWSIQLFSGRIVSWSVPSISPGRNIMAMQGPERFLSPKDPLTCPRAVHTKGISLGFVCNAGNTTTWMNQSTMSTGKEFLLGSIPQSGFGCVMGAGQECWKFHRSLLGQDDQFDRFRSDLMNHEVMCPSDFVLHPPAFLSSFYTLVVDTTAARLDSDGDSEDHLNQHLLQKLRAGPFEEAAFRSLQLLVLRSVEEISSIRKSAAGESVAFRVELTKGMFARLVGLIFESTTRLQFASFFLEIGRQIEPSCFPFLFPLPLISQDGTPCPLSLEDLFSMTLQQGSIRSAVAALPLFENQYITSSMCAGVFQACLLIVDSDLAGNGKWSPALVVEARIAMRDIFRFAGKLNDPNGGNVEDEESSSDDSVEGPYQQQGYSIMCGFGRWFGGHDRRGVHSKDQLRPSIGNGFHNGHDLEETTFGDNGSKANHYDSYRNGSGVVPSPPKHVESVAGVAGRYIVKIIFDQDMAAQWTTLGYISNLLIGDTKAGFHFCSSSVFARLMTVVSTRALRDLLPGPLEKKGDITRSLLQFIRQCNSCISADDADAVLDVVLILLDRQRFVTDVGPEIPGLVLIALIVGHVSNRIANLVDDDDVVDVPIWNAYLDARSELQSIYS